MKKLLLTTLLLTSIFISSSNAQEKYGRTLNLGLGVGGYSGYYGYAGTGIAVFNLNYEFDVARNFTLAPSISFYTSGHTRYLSGNKNFPSGYYGYREIVVPVGIKGTYYFDELFNANSHWDFYLAGSLGFAIVNRTWDVGYYEDRNYYPGPSPLFLDLHVGAEYHFNNRIGAFLDLSTGVSTIGLAFHGSGSGNGNNDNSPKKNKGNR